MIFRTALILCALVSAFAQTPQTSAPAAAQPTTPQPPADARYVLQVGDDISIKVLRNSEYDDVVRIGPDERISAVYLPDHKAAGKTVEQLRTEITAAYSKYLRDPQVTVVVRNFSNQRIFVGGEVLTPGLMPLSGKMTVLSAVMQAGGFRPTAKTNTVVLIRNNGAEQPIAMKLDVKAMLAGRGKDVPLQSFDVVYVPLSKIARVDRFIDQYIRQAIPASLNAGFTYLQSPGPAVIRFQ